MGNIHFINAGAGSGKTTTLVSIISDLLGTDQNDPSEFILTTYTRAAAKEFHDKTLKKLLEGSDAARKAATKLDAATIGTVHSIAMQYLQRYWHLLGFSGSINVMTKLDREKHINSSLKKHAKPEAIAIFREYRDTFSLKRNNGDKIVEYSNFWKDDVAQLIDKCHSYGIPVKSLDRRNTLSLIDSIYCHAFNGAEFDKYWNECLRCITHALSNLKTNKDGSLSKNSVTKKAAYTGLIKTIDAFRNAASHTNAEIEEILKAAGPFKDKDDIGDSLKLLMDYLDTCIKWSTGNGKLVKAYVENIFNIAAAWELDYENHKKANNAIDFSDLERYFLILLDHEEVKSDIKSSIKYLFVDEFQDSNPIQLEIFNKLADLVSEKCYWVGDPKQAIYGFRGSDTSLTNNIIRQFPDVPDTFSDTDVSYNSDKTKSAQRLGTSYRSVETLVDLSNSLFTKAFANLLSPTERITSGVGLKPIRNDGKIARPIVHFEAKGASYDALANAVACILSGSDTDFPGCYDQDLKDSGGKPLFREIKEKDIAILTRKGDDCTKIENALREHGITVSSPETDIKDKAEVRLVLTLLKHIDHIDQKLTRAELKRLLYDKNLDEALKEDSIPDPESLRYLRSHSISESLVEMYAKLDLYNRIGKWESAETRRRNIDKIIALANEYESSCSRCCEPATIRGFLRFFDNYVFESELDNSEDGVKVATYHKSKGLQWPVVILDSLDNKELTLEDQHPSKGFITRNYFGITATGTFGKADIIYLPATFPINRYMAQHIKALSENGKDFGLYRSKYEKVQAEITRLMYVGLTRARDYAVTFTDPEKDATWLKEIFDRNPPVIDPAELSENECIDSIWNTVVPEDKVLKKDLEAVPYTVFNSTPSDTRIIKDPEKDFRIEPMPARIQPSKAETNATKYPFSIPADNPLIEISDYIEHKSPMDYAAFGTCIHDFFAAFIWKGVSGIGSCRDENIKIASRVISNHKMGSTLPDAASLVSAAEKFHTWLTKTYGEESEILRECPFTYRHGDGQTAYGEIDLVWVIKDHGGRKRCILADYKNFSAPKEFGKQIILKDDPDNDLFAGRYSSQLGEYRAALTKAGYAVEDVVIFYSLLGCVVKIKF